MLMKLVHPTEMFVARVIRSNAAVLLAEYGFQNLIDYKGKTTRRDLQRHADLLGGAIRLITDPIAAKDLRVEPLTVQGLEGLRTQYAEEEKGAFELFDISTILQDLSTYRAQRTVAADSEFLSLSSQSREENRLHLVTLRLGKKATSRALSIYHERLRST